MEIEIVNGVQTLFSDFTVFISTFFSYFSSWVGFVFVLFTFLLFCRFRFVLTFGISAAITSAVVNLLKIVIRRPRPYMASMEVMNLLEETGFSMPSGHTANAAVISIFLAYWIYLTPNIKSWLKWLLWSMCGLFVAITMFSRIFLGQHYLSDTIVGLIIGAGLVIGGVLIYDKFIKDKSFKKKQ